MSLATTTFTAAVENDIRKVESFLTVVGRDFSKALPVILAVAQEATPFVSAYAGPAVGALFATTVGVTVQAEQKYAAMNKQSGTGAQKLADVVSVIGPVAKQALSIGGVQASDAQVNSFVDAVVGVLNAIPASAAPATN